MPRRRRVLVGLVLALAGGLFVANRLPGWSARILERRLSQVFQRPVTVGRVSYRLVPFQAEVRDVRVAGLRAEDPPFLEVPRAVAATAPRRLWDGEVDILELRIQQPRVHIHAFPQGGDDIPKLRLGSGGRGSLRLRRVIVEGGELWVDHDRVPLDLDLPDLRVRLAEAEGGRLRGVLAAGPGEARFGTNPPFPLDTEATLAIEGGRVSVETGRLRMPEGNLTFRGQVHLSPLRGEFTAEGPVDLGILDRHVLRTGFGLQGSARYRGDVRVVGSRLRLAGRMEGTRGVFDGIAVPRYAGAVRWDETGVHLEGLQTTLMGGAATFDVHVPPVPAHARVDAKLEGVDAEEATAYLFDLGRAGLGAGARGTVSLQWPRGRVRELSGRVDLELQPKGDGRTPLSGRLAWRARDGQQVVEDADLVTPATRARLRGTIDRTSRTDLAVEAGSTDLALSDALGVRVRRALGRPDAEAVGLSGAGGAFSGHWRGTLQDPTFEGRFTGQDVTFLGVPWGRAEWAGSTDPREVQYRSLVLRRGAAEMWLDGRMQTGFYGEQDAVDLRVRLKDWPARDLVTALQWDLEMEGPVSGEATVRGRRSAPEGHAHLTSTAGQYYGVAYEGLEARTRFAGGITTVDAGQARVGDGRVTFEGTLTDDGVYDGQAHLEGLAAAAVASRMPPALRATGRLSGDVVLQGTLERPRLAAQLTSPRLSLGGEDLGALVVRATGRGDGQVNVDGTVRAAHLDLAVTGRVGAAPPYHAELAAALKDSRLDAFLRAAFPGVPAGTGLAATGTAQVRGPLTSPRDLGGQVHLSALEVRLPEYPVRNRAPIRMAVRDGRLDVESLQMSGEGTDVEVTGRVGLQAGGGLDLRVQGATDLRTVSLFSQELRGEGAARISVAVTGARDAPSVDGALEIEGAGVRVRGFPHGVEDLRGVVRFDGTSASFAGVTGRLGGGPVELEGRATSRGGRLASFDVQATGRGLTFRYPEGLKSTVDADLRLFGDESQQWLTGEVQVRQAVWTRRYDVATELLARRRLEAPQAVAGGRLRYDVKVRAPGTLSVDNNLATVHARADLTLSGTYAAPVLLGRAEIDRGRVYFQGNTYEIRRGTVDFLDPMRLDPLFDLEAETRVRSYAVTLKLNGTLERVYPSLTSDPPLNTLQIVNLLAGRSETEETLPAGQSESYRAGGEVVGSVAAGWVTEEFERKVTSRLGLTRFSIDPSVVRGEFTNPVLTVGKRISPDLDVLYSRDVRGDETLVALEYTFSDRLSVLMTLSDPGGYGFDLRWRQTY
jgi:translocation and assembly module TamB